MSLSPLQNKILELSAKVIETDNPAEFARLADELRQVLREQVTLLRDMVDEARKNISGTPSVRFQANTGTDS